MLLVAPWLPSVGTADLLTEDSESFLKCALLLRDGKWLLTMETIGLLGRARPSVEEWSLNRL